MNAEILKLLLESTSGVTVLALGIWYLIAKLKDRKADPRDYRDYVSKRTFYETVKETRSLADKYHRETLTSIDKWGDKIEAARDIDRQNLFDHVSNH